MAQVFFTDYFVEEIKKKFSESEGNKILDLLETLEENPYKGKELLHVGKTLLKEIKYEKFRFYFITDGFKIKFLKVTELQDLIIKFVRMSDKKDQQKVIEEIRRVLIGIGEGGF
jgi:mRNA-degrading endonuclease RelE of RelBE toxin-antitoxin system